MSKHPENIQRPSIFDYGNFRSFLSAMISYKRAQGEYSHREFAKKAGFGSHSFMTLVIQGRRNVSVEAAKKIAGALDLDPEEEDFFVSMVRLNETEDQVERDFVFSKMQKSVKSQLVKKEIFDQFEFYEDWANVAVYEALPVEWTKVDAAAFERTLDLTSGQLSRIINLLLRLNLIEEADGLYRRRNWAIRTPDATQSALVRRFHHSMGGKALDALEEVDPNDRDFGAVTLTLSRENFEKVRDRLRSFRDELNTLFSEERNPEGLYQLNIQLFPLLNIKDLGFKK